jgi:type II secretory pathway component PulF
MPVYRYNAVDASGQRRSGDVVAPSLDAARQQLQADGFTSVAVTGHAALPASLDTSATAAAVTIAIDGGRPLAAGLRAVAAESPSSRMRRSLEGLAQRIEAGQPLEAALAAPGLGVPDPLAAVIRAGLRANRLPAALSRYIDLFREARTLRQSLWAGLAYPILLAVLSVSITFALAWLLLPAYEAIFEDFGVRLPGMTQFFMTTAWVLRHFGVWILLGIIFLTAIALAVGRLVIPADVRSQLIDLLPVVGPARRNQSLARFCRLLSLLMESQAPLPDSLRLAGAATNPGLAAAVDILAAHVEAGDAPDAALKRTPQLPGWLGPLLRWHDRGPAFSEALDAAADLCIAGSRSQLTLVTLIAEPAVIVFVAITVGFAVLSLFLPLTSLLNELS